MKPYYEKVGIQIFHGDCQEILPHLEAVDLILTDPPYGLSGKQKEAEITVQGHAPFRRQFGEWDCEWSPRELLAVAEKILRTGGSFIAFCAHMGIPDYMDTPLEQKKLGV